MLTLPAFTSHAAVSLVLPAIRVHRLSSPLGEWELALGEPSPALRPFVQGCYAGSVERIAGTLTRLELPHPGIVCIFNFGDPFRVIDPRQREASTWLGSFVAGLYDSYVHVDARGVSQCVQCNLTPLGAARLLGMPMEPITNRSVPMETLLGSVATDVAGEMLESPSWEGRFAVLERTWLRRLAASTTGPAAVQDAWRMLSRADGNVGIANVADELGMSRRRLTAQFREQVGLPPKLLARILRFHRVVERLVATEGRRLSEVAHDCGYYDHAHFDRDFREFSGLTPSEYFVTRHPTFGSILFGD